MPIDGPVLLAQTDAWTILWIVLGAFKQTVDIFQLKVFFTPTLENFSIIWGGQFDIKTKLINSLIVAGATVAVTIPLATAAAYSFSRFKMRGGRFLLVLILSLSLYLLW